MISSPLPCFSLSGFSPTALSHITACPPPHLQGGDKARGADAKSSGKVGRHTVRRLSQLCPHVGVFARVAPDQKEVIIDALNAVSLFSLPSSLCCGYSMSRRRRVS